METTCPAENVLMNTLYIVYIVISQHTLVLDPNERFTIEEVLQHGAFHTEQLLHKNTPLKKRKNDNNIHHKYDPPYNLRLVKRI